MKGFMRQMGDKLGFITFFKLLFRLTEQYWASVLTFGF